MNCVILQPSYIPWRGFFHQIQKADVFVFFDDVQFDARGWRNRNRIKTPQGTQWLTIPVHKKGARTAGTLVKDVRINWESDWSRKHLTALRLAYKGAPFFARYEPLLAEFYARRDELLADFTIDFTVALARELGIEGTRFVRSSTLVADGHKTDRLLAILQALGADHYISGPSARAYLDEAKLASAGIGVEYMTYDYPEYEQRHAPYDPQVSILDLLFAVGPEAPRYIWDIAGAPVSGPGRAEPAGTQRRTKMPQPKTLEDIAATLHDTEFPRQITLEICAYCNLRCVMCPHPTMRRTQGIMSEEIYRKCVDEIASVAPQTEVWLADHGESLMVGPAIIDMVRYAKSKGLPKLFLNSNGMLLTHEISRGLVEAGLDRIVFGIDGYDAESYRKIRVGGDLDTVVRNIDGLLEERARKGTERPEIWVQFIDLEENAGEMAAFTAFWQDRGVGVKTRKKLSWGAYIESKAVSRESAERIPCQWIVNLMHVLWDGRVCRCSGDHECDYPMGNVLESSIAEIWRGPLREERQVQLRREFDKINEQCRECLDWKVGAAEKLPPGTVI
jgi:radical SAM protein with 4Fe4S-binding SPASM domain